MKDLTQGKLQESLAFAQTKNDPSLQNCLDNLKRVEENCDLETDVFSDRNEHCFVFVRKRNGNFAGNGGIIFHGHKDSGHIQNGSVQMTPSYGWQTHT